jgi:outer membrane lipoprotein-sorting protein
MNFNARLAACAATILFCVVATTSFAAVTAPGAKPSAPALPPVGASQLVEKNVAARGGLAAWQSIKSISFTGSLDAGKVRPDDGLNPASTERLIEKTTRSSKIGQAPEQTLQPVDPGKLVTLPYTLILQRPNKQRIEIKFKDETLVQTYDGEHGWKLQPYLNRGGALPFSKDEMKTAKDFPSLDGPLIDYAAKGTKISADGTELVDSRPAYRLKLTLKDGSVRRIWLDAGTFLDVQVDGTRRLNGHDVTTYTAQRDFRTVSGVQVPYEMETRTAGLTDREKIRVDKVAVNPVLDASLFAKPQ